MIDNKMLSSVVDKIGGDPSSLKLLGGFNNGVYEVKINNKDIILKFYLANQREKTLIKGELDWVNFLAQNGMNIAKPIPFDDNSYIKEISRYDHLYYYVLFEKVTGKFINEESWDERLIEIWGHSMGKMHSLAKSYVAPTEGKIINWYESDIITEPPATASETILAKWGDYIKKVKDFSTSIDSFGVIHNDLHHQNIYFNNGSVQLFDFDACEYSWFIYDISISLYHAVQVVGSDEGKRLDFATSFLRNFMNGYVKENKVFDSWIDEIEFFLDYRRIYSYLYILKHLKGDQMNERLKEILDDMKNKIEKDIPYLKGLKTQLNS